MKRGLIYKPGEPGKFARIGLSVKILKLFSFCLSWIGVAMMITAVFGLIFVYLPLGFAEIKYAWSKTQLARMVAKNQLMSLEQKQQAKKQKAALEGKPLSEIDKLNWDVPDLKYSVYIPKIMATSKVIPNVNSDDPKAYQMALKQGVAEAAGLAHPGNIGTTYLFAHSVGTRLDFARYNAVFYLLDKLGVGDKIQVVYFGKLFNYEVVGREILAPTDIKYLIPQSLSEKLVLQTCYPPGTSWKRLIVVARRY